MTQFRINLGADVYLTGDRALLRPVDSAFVLDGAFVVACASSHSVLVFYLWPVDEAIRVLEQSWLCRPGTRPGWEGVQPVGCKPGVASLSGAIVGSGLGLSLPWSCPPYPEASLL